MSFNFLDQGFLPEDSYSRMLDKRVAMDEYPYGYTGNEPPAGHANHGIQNDHYECPRLKRQGKPWQKSKE